MGLPCDCVVDFPRIFESRLDPVLASVLLVQLLENLVGKGTAIGGCRLERLVLNDFVRLDQLRDHFTPIIELRLFQPKLAPEKR